jgi:K+-sensing histidine kinase KdpD
MLPQDLNLLVAAIEAFAACRDVDMLLAALLTHTRRLFRMDAAFVWLTADDALLCLQCSEGAPPSVASSLQQLKMSTNTERMIAKRLQNLGYRMVLCAPLRRHTNIVGMVAASCRRSRRSRRIEAAIFRRVMRSASGSLERLRSISLDQEPEARPRLASDDDLGLQNERMRFMSLFISGIAHDLNNAITTISGRVELLLNRLHDQVTLQHLGAAHGASAEVAQMVRHIHNLISGFRHDDAVLVDINQVVLDSIQVARSTWFQEFRHTRVPVELDVDLSPVPALLSRALDLRIVLLCLLRHAMDTVRPGGGVMIRTWCEGDAEQEMVLVRIGDDPGEISAAEGEQGLGSLLSQLHVSDSQRALRFVQTICRDLGVRLTVQRDAAGGTISTLMFSARGTTDRHLWG